MKKELTVLLLIALGLILARARFYLPELLYKALPYIYIILALIASALIHHPLAIATGAVLGGTGVWVFSMRSQS